MSTLHNPSLTYRGCGAHIPVSQRTELSKLPQVVRLKGV